MNIIIAVVLKKNCHRSMNVQSQRHCRIKVARLKKKTCPGKSSHIIIVFEIYVCKS